MKKIYAPWRHGYITDTLKNKKPSSSDDGCVFCTQFGEGDDEKNLILKRYKHVGIIINYYPYNAGHLMVLPIAHKAELSDLTVDEQHELIEVTNTATEAVRAAMKPHGFNIGINLGEGSGGGLPSHLHVHILPRWKGDTNFMPTLGNTKVICSDLREIYDLLKQHLD